ncbi:MAG: undecaprenyl-diphosphate phosphatase [Actinobacteria bacterium]|nr:undecaprenyl-diphosphate phosphatase [Actinomycetota bacterium]
MPPAHRSTHKRSESTSYGAAMLIAVLGGFAAALMVIGLGWARATPLVAKTDVDPAARATAQDELTAPKAVVLGAVEGVTEFLPVSSTGHLLVAERLLDVGKDPSTKDVADAYTVAIQAGAILAVLLLYWRRLWSMVAGLVGKSDSGRRVLVGVVVAAIPIAIVGLAFEKKIKERLLEPGPVIIAWLVGGALLLVYARRWDEHHEGTELDAITIKQAALIGLAQVLSLWPGTSRSLVTIVAGLAVGLSLAAAVEFSFVLGFVTLGAATAYELVKNGPAMIDTYGRVNPLIGLVVAFLAAAIAIRWMVSYLQRHSIAVFGYYRIGVAVLAGVLLLAGRI